MLKYCLLVFVLLGTVLSVNAKGIPKKLKGVELYDWLSWEGIYDPEIDNEAIRKALEKGLFGDDEDVANAAILTIGWYAARVNWESRQPIEDDPLVVRDVQDIPGLRKFLVDRWSEKYEENPNYIAEMNDSDAFDRSEERNGRQITRLDKVWMSIPNMLATLYPKDSEVHEIIWKAYNPKQDFQMLSRLDAGEFNTQKAIDFRIKVLLDGKTTDHNIAAAARGLGLFQSDEGLEALLARARNTEKRTSAMAHIIEAIVAHEEKAVPFADLLRRTAEIYDLTTNRKLQRPSHYNSTHTIGQQYRVQQALQKLKELEEAQEDDAP